MPTVDGRELKAHPLWLLNNVPTGAADLPSSVPYLTGLNHEDGVEVILEDRTLGEFTDFLEVDQSYLHAFVIEYAFRHNYTMNKEAIVEAIESFYTYWPDPADVWRIREKFIEVGRWSAMDITWQQENTVLILIMPLPSLPILLDSPNI